MSSFLVILSVFVSIFSCSMIPLISTSSVQPLPLKFSVTGAATVYDDAIHLTEHHKCSITRTKPEFGRVLFDFPIPFFSESINSSDSFAARFSFVMSLTSPDCLSGDGIAFVVTSDLNKFVQSDIGSLGLPKQSPTGSYFIAVEFDTAFDESLYDLNDNHLSIDMNSFTPLVSVDLNSVGINLNSGREIHAWLQYTNTEKIMRVWIGYGVHKPEVAVLVSRIDLSERFGGSVFFGISASSGSGSSLYIIRSFYLKTWKDTTPFSVIDAVGPRSCQICFPPPKTFGYFFWYIFTPTVTIVLVIAIASSMVCYVYLNANRDRNLFGGEKLARPKPRSLND